MMSERGLFLEIGLATTVVLGVIFFGAVYPWVAMALYAMLFLLVSVFPRTLLTPLPLPRFFRFSGPIIFLFLFIQIFFTSVNRYQTGEEFLKWLALASAFLLTQLFSADQIRRFFKLLVMVGVCEVLYGIIQVCSGSEMILWRSKEAYWGYLTGTFVYRNHLAGLLEICLGIQIGFCAEALWQKKFKTIIVQFVFFGALIMGLLKTGSRMGLLSFLFAFLLFFPALLKKFSGFLKIIISALTGAVVIGAFWFERSMVSSRWLGLKYDLAIGEGRWLVWRDALRMFFDHGWAGIGLGGFKWLYPRYQSQDLLLGWSHAHNDYLELLVELGLPAFLLVSAVFIGLWVILFRKLCRLNPKEYFMLCGVLAALTAFWIHGIMDFVWAIPINNLIIVIILGLGIRLLQFPEAFRDPS